MDEQCRQAYLNLTEQLLACFPDRAPEILDAHNLMQLNLGVAYSNRIRGDRSINQLCK